ncbi:hypothetical protein SAMN06297144_1750 [Sphingomonas guangdongensis]|uniref:Protease inhibitor Inh n=1 Tax=Sphingomonas guangdongensis TaxID=1141890 RepID=A0A285QXL2_9SPHN|nr:hypothetical protein [Sphingomonas guangdongensis]SOB86643.1 hypothetical protein SAMN06297144_1750 [Sphingomonas guangdongensis]
MMRHALLALPLLLAACGSDAETNVAAVGNSVAVVPPQPGGAIEEVPAGEGGMAGRPDQDAAVANAAGGGATGMMQADYLGRWVGVEGMVMTVAARPGGGVRIDNQWDLDHRGSFDGTVSADGLRFVRGGEAVVARRSDGDATGLKWLAGKRDCLTVKSGEGYCRD